MPGIWLTSRPFEEIIYDLSFIVPRIDLEWFADARWLQRKDASISRVSLYDWVTLSVDAESVVGIAVVAADFEGKDSSGAQDEFQEKAGRDFYNVPLLVTKSQDLIQGEPLVVVTGSDFIGYVYDATGAQAFVAALLGAVKTGAVVHSERGYFQFDRIGSGALESTARTVITDDRDTTNTVIMVDNSQVIKVYRKLQAGSSPDIEISKGLDKVGFQSIPRPLGYGTYSGWQGVICPAFFVQEFIENEGDAWSILCREALESLKAQLWDSLPQEDGDGCIHDYGRSPGFRESRLGTVTAGLHLASSRIDEDGFTPEVMRPLDVAGLVGNIISAVPITIEELRRANLDSETLAKTISMYESLGRKEAVSKCLRQVEEILQNSSDLGMKIRIHGDLHLGQFLQVRKNDTCDFVIIDFEGEPLRPVCERLRKSSPLRDVAGMLRSFDYSGYSAAFRMDECPDEKEHLMAIAREWGSETGERFLKGYLEAMRRSCPHLLPKDARDFHLLLLCFKLEKALYEIRYELRNRPRWVNIALRGTLDSINEIQSNLNCGEW